MKKPLLSKYNSITVKLLLFFVTVFGLLISGVFLLADFQLKHILDRSNETAYAERVETILRTLAGNDERLQKTGLAEVYLDDFQHSSLNVLRSNYYTQTQQAIFPFILDTNGAVILHPNLARGDLSLEALDNISATHGHRIYRDEKDWYIIKTFEPWQWQIGYRVPLDVLYRDANRFRNNLLVIVGGTSFLLLMMAAVALHRLTRPIIQLTKASKQIAEGNLEQKIDLSSGDEIGILAKSFDDMRMAINQKISELNQQISERERLEQVQKETSRMLRLVLDSIPVRVFWKDVNLTYQGCNQPFAGDAGLQDPEMIKGKDDYDLPWAEQEAEAYRKDDWAVIESGKARFDIEELQTHENGTILWLNTSKVPMVDENDVVVGVLGTYQDITDRKVAEFELKKLRNYLSNIIDSMPSVLTAVDLEGKVILWNRQAQKVTGLSIEEVVGKPFEQALPVFAEELGRIQKAIETSKKLVDPKRSRMKDGDTLYENITIYPLEGAGVEGAVVRIDDVTEQVRLEEMMVQNEKMLSVGGLAAGMAHEINNPLAGMIQTALVMSNRLGADADIPANVKAAEQAGTSMEVIKQFMESRNIPRMLRALDESGKRLAVIVDNMLSFARKSDSDFSFVSLEQLFEKTIELAATDYDLKKHYDFKQVIIKRQYGEDIPDVPCESAKIQQVFFNILKNGAQAMQEVNTVEPYFIVSSGVDHEQQMVIIEIEDNGPGMKESVRKRVFEPFFTTKAVGEGTGLGLSVSYFIITENHGGEMVVESKQGVGTKFIIRLPMAKTT